jgi:hypothetical protein
MGLWDRLAAANAARRADWDWVKAERAARQAALRERGGRPTMTCPTAPQPPQLPPASAQDYQPGEADPFPTLVSPAVLVATSRRKWPWVAGGAVLLSLIIGVANVGYKSSTPTLAASPPQEQALPVSAQVTLPADLVGKSARLADDELRNLGIVNIRYVPGRRVQRGGLSREMDCDQGGACTRCRGVDRRHSRGYRDHKGWFDPAAARFATCTGRAGPGCSSWSAAGVRAAAGGACRDAYRADEHGTPAARAAAARVPTRRAAACRAACRAAAGQRQQRRHRYYKNCGQARAAGAAPIKRGEPGYRPELDRNNDGIACDK